MFDPAWCPTKNQPHAAARRAQPIARGRIGKDCAELAREWLNGRDRIIQRGLAKNSGIGGRSTDTITEPQLIASSAVFGHASARLVMTNAADPRNAFAISDDPSCPANVTRSATRSVRTAGAVRPHNLRTRVDLPGDHEPHIKIDQRQRANDVLEAAGRPIDPAVNSVR